MCLEHKRQLGAGLPIRVFVLTCHIRTKFLSKVRTVNVDVTHRIKNMLIVVWFEIEVELSWIRYLFSEAKQYEIRHERTRDLNACIFARVSNNLRNSFWLHIFKQTSFLASSHTAGPKMLHSKCFHFHPSPAGQCFVTQKYSEKLDFFSFQGVLYWMRSQIIIFIGSYFFLQTGLIRSIE